MLRSDLPCKVQIDKNKGQQWMVASPPPHTRTFQHIRLLWLEISSIQAVSNLLLAYRRNEPRSHLFPQIVLYLPQGVCMPIMHHVKASIHVYPDRRSPYNPILKSSDGSASPELWLEILIRHLVPLLCHVLECETSLQPRAVNALKGIVTLPTMVD